MNVLNQKALIIWTFILSVHVTLVAQDAPVTSVPIPIGVVLVNQQVITKIMQADNETSDVVTDPASLIKYDNVYAPVGYDENGNPKNYDWVKVPFNDPNPWPESFDTSFVTIVLVTLPKLDSTLSAAYKLYFTLKNEISGQQLVNSTYQADAVNGSTFEYMESESSGIAIFRLGQLIPLDTKFSGQVIVEDEKGRQSAAFNFSKT